MVMYDYRSIKQTREEYIKKESEDELYTSTGDSVYKSLTREIDGYTQLSVSGRGLTPYEVESVDFLNRNGAKPLSTRVGTKEFEIKYSLNAKSSKELRGSYEKMMGIFRGGIKIKFLDEEGYYYQDVYLTDASRDEEVSNNVVGTYTLTAFDPNKYVEGVKEGKVVETQSEYTLLEKLTIDFIGYEYEPTVRIKSFSNNEVSEFKLSGSYDSGDKVELRQGTDGNILVEGGTIKLGTLGKDILLYNGTEGEIVGSTNGSVKFSWREMVV